MFARFSRGWRWGLAYLVADQTVALHARGQERWPEPADQQRYMLGITLPLRSAWIGGTIAGLLLGPVIPTSWQLGVIVPLMFIALAVPNVRTLATTAAFAAGGAAVLAFRDLPHGLNLIAGALVGMAAGLAVPEAKRAADTVEEAAV
jgi:predicted branched-subunit amino acid permease